MKRNWLYIIAIVAVTLSVWGGLPAQTARAATKQWDGGAGTSNWNDANNWSDDIVPITTDDVVLDNTFVLGSYAVNLPTGAASIAIVRLTISPNAGNTITATLPSGNTANPGFTIGDAVAGTDDIILNDGAVLQNSSGATGGNGIAANTVTTGTVRINNGGRYIHNTPRSTGGIVPVLSTVAGTETGVFEYDSPGTASVSISASGRTYGSLVLTRSTGAATYSASGGSALTIRGHFIINAGVTFNSTMTGALNVGGNITNNGAALKIPGGQGTNLNGTAEQTIGGTNVITFANLTITNTTGVVIPATNTPVVTGTLVNSGTLKQAQTVGANATDVKFLEITNGAGTVKYHGAEITNTLATSMDLVTVTVKGNQPCTTDTASAPVQRCFNIAPTTSATATIKFWYTSSELNDNDLASLKVYHWTGTQPWITYTTGLVTGIEGSDSFIQVDGIDSFSPFVLSSNPSGPTAVTMNDLAASSPASPAPIVLSVFGLFAGGLILRRRATQPTHTH